MDWKPGSHASTFGGNPVAIAASLATIDILEREGIANAAAVGGKMLERLHTWVAQHPIVGQVRGIGLMIGIEIVKDQQTREVAGSWRDRIVELAFERGLLILGCGETSIRLAPPLIVNEHEASIALDILEDCIVQVQSEGHTLPQQETAAAENQGA
jgi:4-aminobutyrate aminotransferase